LFVGVPAVKPSVGPVAPKQIVAEPAVTAILPALGAVRIVNVAELVLRGVEQPPLLTANVIVPVAVAETVNELTDKSVVSVGLTVQPVGVDVQEIVSLGNNGRPRFNVVVCVEQWIGSTNVNVIGADVSTIVKDWPVNGSDEQPPAPAAVNTAEKLCVPAAKSTVSAGVNTVPDGCKVNVKVPVPPTGAKVTAVPRQIGAAGPIVRPVSSGNAVTVTEAEDVLVAGVHVFSNSVTTETVPDIAAVGV
jgi:hypothetical protein